MDERLGKQAMILLLQSVLVVFERIDRGTIESLLQSVLTTWQASDRIIAAVGSYFG